MEIMDLELIKKKAKVKMVVVKIFKKNKLFLAFTLIKNKYKI